MSLSEHLLLGWLIVEVVMDQVAAVNLLPQTGIKQAINDERGFDILSDMSARQCNGVAFAPARIVTFRTEELPGDEALRFGPGDESIGKVPIAIGETGEPYRYR